MKWLTDLIKNNPFHAMALPTTASIASFLSLLVPMLQGGDVTDAVFHQMLTGASGFQSLLLVIIMIAMKDIKKN